MIPFIWDNLVEFLEWNAKEACNYFAKATIGEEVDVNSTISRNDFEAWLKQKDTIHEPRTFLDQMETK